MTLYYSIVSLKCACGVCNAEPIETGFYTAGVRDGTFHESHRTDAVQDEAQAFHLLVGKSDSCPDAVLAKGKPHLPQVLRYQSIRGGGLRSVLTNRLDHLGFHPRSVHR